MIQSTPYEQHRDYVLAVLAKRCGWLDGSDREAALHDAYTVLLEKERSGELRLERMHARKLRAYLTQTAMHKALDEGKRAERKRTVPLGDGFDTHASSGPSPDEQVSASLDSAPVREIVAELPARRQTIVKLRFYFDRSPEEIQRLLGITERVYRRELERAMRQITERYQLVQAGQWCETRRSLVLAYVAGIAGPNRMAEAKAHLAVCPGCARLAADSLEAARQAAAAIPLPAMALDDRMVPRLTELLAAARDAMADVAGAAKHQAVHLATRADPSSAQFAAAARPGSAVAAVAGCLAAAGGATYCVVAEVPEPLRAIVTQKRDSDAGESRADRERERSKRERESRARLASARPQPVATPVATATPRSTPRPKAKSSRRSSKRRSKSVAEKEFGPSGLTPDSGSSSGNPTAQQSSAGGSSPSQQSAPPRSPAPSGPASEFSFDADP